VQTLRDTQPVIFNTSPPEDSLRRYVVEALEKQNHLAERALHQSTKSPTSYSSPRTEEADERGNNMDTSMNASNESTPRFDDMDYLPVTLPQSHSGRLERDTKRFFRLPDDGMSTRITRPNTGTGRSPRIVVPLVPHCSFPSSHSAVPDVRVVGRASALSARTRPSSRTSRPTDANLPHESVASAGCDVAPESGIGNRSSSAAEVDTKYSEALGWPFLMVVKGYGNAQSDRMPSYSYSAPVVRRRPMTAVPAKPGDAAASRSRNRAAVGSGAAAAQTDFFLVSHLEPKVETKAESGGSRGDHVQEARPYATEISIREQRRQALLREVS